MSHSYNDNNVVSIAYCYFPYYFFILIIFYLNWEDNILDYNNIIFGFFIAIKGLANITMNC